MTARQSTASRRVFSASAVLDAIASELSTIKHEDGLTDADLGRVLGKSEDQAAKYRTGLAEMGIVAYAAGKREWNGRLSGALDRLCHDSRPAITSDAQALTALADLTARLAKALEDGVIKPDEVRGNRAQLEGVRDLINDQLAKLGPVSAGDAA